MNPEPNLSIEPGRQQASLSGASTRPPCPAPGHGGNPAVPGRTKPHAFSNTVANLKSQGGTKLGATAAIILRYLANRIRAQGSKRADGKRWFRVTIDHILKQYPYLGRSTVAENLKRLETFGACEVGNLNQEQGRPRFDRTRWYRVPTEFMDMAEQELRYFDPEIAKTLGLPAAVVYGNFAGRLKELRKHWDGPSVDLRPADLAERLPFDRSTCKRAIKSLKDEKLIFPVPRHPGCYSDKPLDDGGPNPDGGGSDPDDGGSDPDETGSNPDNNIVSKLERISLEGRSKRKPAACCELSDPQANESRFLSVEPTGSVPHPTAVEPFVSGPTRPIDVSDALDETTAPERSAICAMPEGWTTISNYRDIVANCAAINQAFTTAADEQKQKFVRNISNAAIAFVRSQNPLDVLEWQQCRNADELYPLVAPHLWEFFRRHHPPDAQRKSPPAATIVGTAHIVFAGFFTDRRNTGIEQYPLPALGNLRREENRFLVEVLRITIPLKQRLEAERVAARQREFASADEAKECLADLSPAEKTRIFRNAVNSRNQVGWRHYTGQRLTNQIKVTRGGLAEIERLFELNRDLTERELLHILDLAMEALMDASPPGPEYEGGLRWHARQGATDVWRFARFLRAIVKDVDYECTITFLGDAPKPRLDGQAAR